MLCRIWYVTFFPQIIIKCLLKASLCCELFLILLPEVFIRVLMRPNSVSICLNIEFRNIMRHICSGTNSKKYHGSLLCHVVWIIYSKLVIWRSRVTIVRNTTGIIVSRIVVPPHKFCKQACYIVFRPSYSVHLNTWLLLRHSTYLFRHVLIIIVASPLSQSSQQQLFKMCCPTILPLNRFNDFST